jgi:hypothetical protein
MTEVAFVTEKHSVMHFEPVVGLVSAFGKVFAVPPD